MRALKPHSSATFCTWLRSLLEIRVEFRSASDTEVVVMPSIPAISAMLFGLSCLSFISFVPAGSIVFLPIIIANNSANVNSKFHYF